MWDSSLIYSIKTQILECIPPDLMLCEKIKDLKKKKKKESEAVPVQLLLSACSTAAVKKRLCQI